MSTFSNQNNLPSLPVPTLDETLDKYLKCAKALASEEQFEKTTKSVEEFRKSTLAGQLQEALENRASEKRNWIEDWWYDAYTTIREPLAPTTNLAAVNSRYPPIPGSQVSRAADIVYWWMKFWERVRQEKIPITKSRGVVWDMHQYYVLFNSTRVPALPKDIMTRYFKTEAEGSCPSHIVVICRGQLWKVDVVQYGEIMPQDQLHHAFDYILKNSKPAEHSVVTLTTSHRDKWAKNRSLLLRDKTCAASLKEVEEAVLCVTLADEIFSTEESIQLAAMTGSHKFYWQDKCLNLAVFGDGQTAVQGDHSNVDAIAILHAGDDVAERIRKNIWEPKEPIAVSHPKQLQFNLSSELINAISDAEADFSKLKDGHRVRVIHYKGYGNDALRAPKIYSDTVVQIAMQLSFLKTHGRFAPIYETASTRKFYHGRTETVRGCTQEMVSFGRALMNGAAENELQKLFKAAYDAHNDFMTMCMEGRGIDRHFLGLRNTLEEFNKGCSPKQKLPSFMDDDVWKMTGGGGNFLLSTSFTGYMIGKEIGGYGYVCAMRPDGYGTFYKIGNDRFVLVATDYKGTKSNIDGYAENLTWAFDQLGKILIKPNSKM